MKLSRFSAAPFSFPLLIALLSFFVLPSLGLAQDFPTKPITRTERSMNWRRVEPSLIAC